jgi:hypothetical protein
MIYAKMAATENLEIKYYQTLHKKNIGRKFALMYERWSSLEVKAGNLAEAVTTLQLALTSQAEPAHLILAALRELQPPAPVPAATAAAKTRYDDGEVVFKVAAYYLHVLLHNLF